MWSASRLFVCSVIAAGLAWPQLPFPGKRKSNTSSKREAVLPTSTTRGMVRRFESNLLIIEAEDKRVVRFTVSKETKYQQQSKDIYRENIHGGDHLLVEAVENEDGALHATLITLEKVGSEADKAAAPLDDGLLVPALDPEDAKKKLEKLESGRDPDDERPTQRRPGAKPATPEPSTAKKDAPKAASPAPAAEEDEGPRRPATAVLKKEETLDNEDHPRLQRGKPKARPSSSKDIDDDDPKQPVTVASAAGAPRQPEEKPLAGFENPKTSDERIEKAREAVFNYMETLPNYICLQSTTRYQSTDGGKTWNAKDVVSAELIVENGRERYRNLMHNFKKTDKKMDELGGTWSAGEFVTSLRGIFEPFTATAFTYRRPDSLNNRSAFWYNYVVEQARSGWTIHSMAQSYRPSYKGSVWIDRDTFNVLRVEMVARQVPQDFPFDTLESTTEFDFVRLSTKEFLLPTKSQVLSCERGTGNCTRNDIEFRNYRKFAAESTLIPN